MNIIMLWVCRRPSVDTMVSMQWLWHKNKGLKPPITCFRIKLYFNSVSETGTGRKLCKLLPSYHAVAEVALHLDIANLWQILTITLLTTQTDFLCYNYDHAMDNIYFQILPILKINQFLGWKIMLNKKDTERELAPFRKRKIFLIIITPRHQLSDF